MTDFEEGGVRVLVGDCRERLRERSRVEVHAVGLGAVNQAVKAIAIARGYVATNGVDLVCVPSFALLAVDGEERVGIRLLVEGR